MENVVLMDKRRFFRPMESIAVFWMQELAREEAQSHLHNYLEICYVYEGSGYHVLDGCQTRAEKGCMFILDRRTPHAFFKTEGTRALVTVNILCDENYIEHKLRRMNMPGLPLDGAAGIDFNNMPRACRVYGERAELFDALALKMTREYAGRQSGYERMLDAYLTEWIVEMDRLSGSAGIRETSRPISMGGATDTLQMLFDYLGANYRDKINLSELARLSCFSRNYLCRIFKAHTGMSVGEYIQRCRIQEACRLLSETSMTISNVATQVGFADYKFFRACFIRRMGTTPSQFRKRHKGEVLSQII